MTYTKDALKEAIQQKLRLNYGCTEKQATDGEIMKACALALRDIMAVRSVDTQERTQEQQEKRVHYMSLEFLMGRSLMKNAYNLGILPQLTQAVEELLRPGYLRHGAGRGPWQRRPGPPGRLLSGQHDHPGHSRHRLLHLL